MIYISLIYAEFEKFIHLITEILLQHSCCSADWSNLQFARRSEWSARPGFVAVLREVRTGCKFCPAPSAQRKKVFIRQNRFLSLQIGFLVEDANRALLLILNFVYSKVENLMSRITCEFPFSFPKICTHCSASDCSLPKISAAIKQLAHDLNTFEYTS